jgi:hypothetical protein
MLVLKQARIEKLEFDVAAMQGDAENTKILHSKEINQLQSVVAELQIDRSVIFASIGPIFQLFFGDRESAGRERSVSDRRRLELFLTGLSRNGKFHEAIALKDISDADRDRTLSFATVDGVSLEDEFERSPYGSLGTDVLERLMQSSVTINPADAYDAGSLQALTGSISSVTQNDDQ